MQLFVQSTRLRSARNLRTVPGSRSAAARAKSTSAGSLAVLTAHAPRQSLARLFGAMIALPVAGLVAGQAACSATTKEPATGLEFANTSEGKPLVGTGCRYKFGLVKVYAVALYTTAKPPCAPSETEFWGHLVNSTQPKSIVIKMARGITSQQLAEALDDAFKPRLSMPGRSDEGWQKFRGVLLKAVNKTCNAGDQFVFECEEGNKLTLVSTQGSTTYRTESIVDKDICWALFDTYLGAVKPEVAPSLKKDIAKGF